MLSGTQPGVLRVCAGVFWGVDRISWLWESFRFARKLISMHLWRALAAIGHKTVWCCELVKLGFQDHAIRRYDFRRAGCF